MGKRKRKKRDRKRSRTRPFSAELRVASLLEEVVPDVLSRLESGLEAGGLVLVGPPRSGKGIGLRRATHRLGSSGSTVVLVGLRGASVLADVHSRLIASLGSPDQPRAVREVADRARQRLASEGRSQDPEQGFRRLRSRGPDHQASALEALTSDLSTTIQDLTGKFALALDGVGGALKPDPEVGWVAQLLGDVSFPVVLTVTQTGDGRWGSSAAHVPTIEIGSLPSGPAGSWIRGQFKRAGLKSTKTLGDRVVRASLGRAHDVASLAEAVYREAVGRGRARRRHIRRALDGLTAGASPRLTNRWQALTALQQNLLRAVAAGERQLFAGRVRSDFGLRSSAAVARTITLLVDKGVLAKSENGLEFDDPLMRHWVSTHALRDVGIFPAKP